MKFAIALIVALIVGQSSVFAAELKLKIFFISSPDKLEEVFTTSYEHTPTIKTLKKAKKNQLVYAGFAVSGFKLSNERELCLDLDIKIVDPNGKLIFSQEPFIKDKRVVSKESGQLLLNGLLDFLIEDNDPVGVYQVSARLVESSSKCTTEVRG